MVIDLRRRRKWRADLRGHRWQVGSYRRITRAAQRYRVFLNGHEVTGDTFYVDTRRGVIRLLLRDENGHAYLDADRNVASVEKRGRVKLVRRKAAA